MLKSLEKLSGKVKAEEEEGLFEGQVAILEVLADQLAEKIILEPGLPMTAIRVAKANLPEEDVEQLEIGFYLRLACSADEAFQWLKHLSARQGGVAEELGEKERQVFNCTFSIAVDWET